ncbi:MAG: glucose-1-phosphate adenylyltransferase [Nitrospirae bacterium]|nr:glucose-1-phosphate adenylyltransferase [Nitrospirota bacterium]
MTQCVVCPQNDDALTFVMAGGKGERLFPLTRDRAKAAVHFGGRYRLIDFVLSNLINSGFYKIKVLVQYKSDSLDRHISKVWRLSSVLNHYIDPVPAQMRVGERWFMGTADAVFQNLNLVENEDPRFVCIFGADHIYKMDVSQMLKFHIGAGAELTIAAVPRPAHEARLYGVLDVNAEGRVTEFREKPADVHPESDGQVLASMGNYIFNTDVLKQVLKEDAEAHDSSHDFGRVVIPRMIEQHRVFAYNFHENEVPGVSGKETAYWRDVGTLESYFDANLDLIGVSPHFNLYNEDWPIRCGHFDLPPAKFVFSGGDSNRMGMALDSMVAEGCILAGGEVSRSVLFPEVRVDSFATVQESILMPGVNVGSYVRMKRVIADVGVKIPDNMQIGFNHAEDRKRFFVTESGLTVIPKGTVLS